jgi:phosphate transport system permease protein
VAAATSTQMMQDAGSHDPDRPRRPDSTVTTGDRIFRGLATACASVSLIIVSATLIFLLINAVDVFEESGVWGFFTKSVWNPGANSFGVFGLMLGTIIVASIAMLIAVPMALAMALFINEYAPPFARKALTTVIDLLAALPSLLYGYWGLAALRDHVIRVAGWITDHLSAIPFFRLSKQDALLTKSSFLAGVVVGFMILPIITSVARDVMSQVPREQCEGALALGGTRWGMIQTVILPFGRNGIVGASLLGFGRALGETIAVAAIISLRFDVNWHVLEEGGGSIAGLIASRFGEATPTERSGLVAAGLALFLLTFAVNFGARRIVQRSVIK